MNQRGETRKKKQNNNNKNKQIKKTPQKHLYVGSVIGQKAHWI